MHVVGTALAKRIATEEVTKFLDWGQCSSWTRKAFTPMIRYRLNLSYIRCRSCWDWAAIYQMDDRARLQAAFGIS